MNTPISGDLIALIVRELKIEPARVTAETALFEGGLELDSFAVVDLVSRIEEHFGIQLADTDFQPENFTDIGTLSAVVARCVSEKA
jgi:acyl carrier protein